MIDHSYLRGIMDYIIKPCDWEAIYLAREQDPNKFGEALRNYCFIGNCMETGCYSTFDLIKVLKEIKSGKIYEEVLKYVNPESEESIHAYHFKLEYKDNELGFIEPYELVVGWEWNGDGTLYFRWNNRSVINTDCKKDYGWDWIIK